MAMKLHMIKGKKGILFTFAAITLVFILLLSFRATNINELKEEADIVEMRILTMNNFIKDVEQDLQKGLQIASFRAFASMIQFVSGNGTYVSDPDQSFDELILQGTLQGQEPSLMKDSTFTDWTDKIAVQAAKIDIAVNFSILDIRINQTDPWNIFVVSTINLTVNDSKGTSSWKRKNEIKAKVSILNLEDPLYAVNSNGLISSPIVQSPITQFTSGDDVSNLLLHANNSYYIASATAPDFLKRLQGDVSNSSVGIESLVNVEAFLEQGLSAKDRSIVDYIYFGNESTANYRINGTPDWFQIDNEHLSVYQVENLTI